MSTTTCHNVKKFTICLLPMVLIACTLRIQNLTTGIQKENQDLLKQKKEGRYSDEARISQSEKRILKNIDELEKKIEDNDLEIEKSKATKINTGRDKTPNPKIRSPNEKPEAKEFSKIDSMNLRNDLKNLDLKALVQGDILNSWNLPQRNEALPRTPEEKTKSPIKKHEKSAQKNEDITPFKNLSASKPISENKMMKQMTVDSVVYKTPPSQNNRS